MEASRVLKIDIKLDIETARGWLQRLVRPIRNHGVRAVLGFIETL
jgi:hypothetical protein